MGGIDPENPILLTLSPNSDQNLLSPYNRVEVKLQVYGKLQTLDSSWEFLKIENEQIKTAQNNSYG